MKNNPEGKQSKTVNDKFCWKLEQRRGRVSNSETKKTNYTEQSKSVHLDTTTRWWICGLNGSIRWQ